MESIPEAWERLQEYILACPYRGMKNWLVVQNFYNGLTPMSRGHIDAAAGGAFLSLTINGATALIEKMVSNQGWGDERLQNEQQKGIHTMKEMDMLATKMDFLMKRLDKHAHEKEAMYGTVMAMDLHMTCEVYGESGHSGNDCPKTHEDALNDNNGFRP